MSRYFTTDHEWIEIDGDIGTVGISDYAQSQLGDITYVELPQPDTELSKGDAASVVESVKAASDVYTPVSGKVAEANSVLEDEPELVNGDAQGAGWLFRLTLADASELETLMDQTAYDAYVAGL